MKNNLLKKIGLIMISLPILFLIGIFVYFLAGGFSVVDKDHKIYKEFKDSCVIKDPKDVYIDWEYINTVIDNKNAKDYGLNEYESNKELQELLNYIYYSNTIENENINLNNPGKYSLKYGAIRCSSRYWTTEAEQEYWFSEPMIEFYFRNKKREEEYKAKGGYTIDGQPLYELGYRAAFTIDGKLALEEGKWFLEEEKNEFLQKELKKIQSILSDID